MSASASAAPASRKRKVASPFFSADILDAYETHVKRLKEVHEMRKEATSLKNVATDVEVVESVDVWDTLGKKQPGDKFNGCTNLRTLRSLLKIIDERGFERSEHQMQFHSAFEVSIQCMTHNAYTLNLTLKYIFVSHNSVV
jgi:hypothetical protein